MILINEKIEDRHQGVPLTYVDRGELWLLPGGSDDRYGVVAHADMMRARQGEDVEVFDPSEDEMSKWLSDLAEVNRLREPIADTRVTASQIHALQNHLGLTDIEFGRLLGVDPSTVRRWKTGQSRPRRKVLRRLEKRIDEMEEEIGEDLDEMAD